MLSLSDTIALYILLQLILIVIVIDDYVDYIVCEKEHSLYHDIIYYNMSLHISP